MSRLRIRLVLNEGGEGAPFGQIVDVGREVERFLRYLAQDAGIAIERAEWVARDFENASVRFDIEAPTSVDERAIESFNRKFEYVVAFDGSKPLDPTVKRRTILQFAKSAAALNAHEKMSFGLYHPGDEKPYEYRHLSKLRAVELQNKLNETLRFITTLQGTIHNLGVEERYFNLRERKSDKLIRCDFPAQLYNAVHEAATKPNGLVYVRGNVEQRRVDRAVEGMKVKDIKAAPRAPDVIERLFGQHPDYTGEVTTQEFIDQQWGDDD